MDIEAWLAGKCSHSEIAVQRQPERGAASQPGSVAIQKSRSSGNSSGVMEISSASVAIQKSRSSGNDFAGSVYTVDSVAIQKSRSSGN